MRAFAEKTTTQAKATAPANSTPRTRSRSHKGRAIASPPRWAQGLAVEPAWAHPIQAKLSVSHPLDPLEQEAERVSEQVMRMPVPGASGSTPRVRAAATSFEARNGEVAQRLCAECEDEEVQRKSTAEHASGGATSRDAEARLDAVRGGQPLSLEQRAFFEPRFGTDFSRVRIHTDGAADAAALSVGALAFTRGTDVVFRRDQYRPDTFDGRRLLAHELTHVVQQGGAPETARGPSSASPFAGLLRHADPGTTLSHFIQRVPGDGMSPPGDCSWASYLPLRGSVETAKAIVGMLGACSPGDSCLFLATKIAAITAEIAARVALDTTCFRGGDTGHRQQVQDKINMLNRCHRFFSTSGCSPELIAAMAVVVERAREVVAAAAIAVALAAVVALVLAIIALLKLIAAAAAAAASGAAVAAGAAAVMAMLLLLLGEISPESVPDA